MLQQRTATPAASTEEQLRRLLLAVCDHWTALHRPMQAQLSHVRIAGRGAGQSAAARAGAQHHALSAAGHVRTAIRGVELLATIVSWAIYGAALEWSQRPGGQSAEAFVEEALPLIAACTGRV